MSNWTVAIGSAVIGSALLAAFVANWQKSRQYRKETVAAATKSALRRLEMYYRVRRRTGEKADDVFLRDLFHEVQEDNDYYIALLDIMSPWLGESYRQFIRSLQAELKPFMSSALKDDRLGPLGAMGDEPKPQVNELIKQFTKDSRRFFNPLMRPFMRLGYSISNLKKEKRYGA